MKLGAKPRASHRRDGSCDRSARVRRCSVGDGRKHLRLRAHDRSRPTRLVRRPPISRTPVPPRTVPPETRSRPSRHALLLHRRPRAQAHVNSALVSLVSTRRLRTSCATGSSRRTRSTKRWRKRRPPDGGRPATERVGAPSFGAFRHTGRRQESGPDPLESNLWPDIASLVELHEPHLVEARFARLGGGEVAGLLFSEFIERSVQLASPHRRPIVNNVMSVHTIDNGAVKVRPELQRRGGLQAGAEEGQERRFRSGSS